jgi:hypothetical protein
MAGVQTQFSTDPNAIVTVHVSIIEAPTPINYQRQGALVSFGATNLAVGATTLLTQLSDLNAPVDLTTPGSPLILMQPLAVSSVSWAAGTITVHTTNPIPNVSIGDVLGFVMNGFVPIGPAYNGLHTCTITGSSQFTYSDSHTTADPGTVTTKGTIEFMTAIELSQMATTFFGQGNEVGVWVLELGYDNNPDNNVAALENWLQQNPLTIYGFLMPRRFGSDPFILGTADVPLPFTNLLKQFEAPSNTMEYFWLTVIPSTMDNLFFGKNTALGSTFKDVIQMVEAPELTDTNLIYVPAVGVDPARYEIPNYLDPNGEFTLAAMFYNALAYRPSNTNRISPMAFKFLYGVTKYPQKNNGPLLRSFKAAATNYVSTGAEGGISFTMVYEGVTLDHHDYFNWWYTIDWVQIEVNLNLSNAIINGSNNPLAPLYYNQDGINYLETILLDTMQDAQTFGMILGKIQMTQFDGPDLSAAINSGTFAGQCDVNAVPFLNYTLANPGDYKIGEYDGLSTLFIPARGFIHILVNVVVTDLVSL